MCRVREGIHGSQLAAGVPLLGCVDGGVKSRHAHVHECRGCISTARSRGIRLRYSSPSQLLRRPPAACKRQRCNMQPAACNADTQRARPCSTCLRPRNCCSTSTRRRATANGRRTPPTAQTCVTYSSVHNATIGVSTVCVPQTLCYVAHYSRPCRNPSLFHPAHPS